MPDYNFPEALEAGRVAQSEPLYHRPDGFFAKRS
jgi:hypothetical protein